MSKIVQAVNSMIANPKLISNVIKTDNDTYFLYKEKYKWSILKDPNGGVCLFYYPRNMSIEDVAAKFDFENIDFIRYSDEEIGTREARASFLELYNLIIEKVYNIDSVLEDIISDNEDLF